MNRILIGDGYRFIPVDELPAAPELHEPDSTEARQIAIRRLLRLLDRERRACILVETFAQEFKAFRTMQAATRLSNAEAQLRHAGDAVALGWDRYRSRTPPAETDRHQHAATADDQESGEQHGGGF